MTRTSQTILNQKASIPPEVVDARIRQLETKYDLLQFKVDGWCVWPLFRFGAAMALQNLPRQKVSGFSRRERYSIAAKDILSLVRLRKARYIALTHISDQTEQENGLYKDIFVDDLLRNVGDYFKIQTINSKIFLREDKAVFIKSDVTTTAFNLLAGHLTKVGGPSYISRIASDLSSCLREEAELRNFTPQVIAHQLLHFYWAKRLYAWLFRRIKPDFLLGVDFGEFDLVASAKEQGIKVVEFQHGFIDRSHPGYSWSPYAQAYKKSMPMPDLLLLYGDYWCGELRATGFWDKELRSVGSVRVDRYRKINRMNQKKEQAYNLLLTTQGVDVEKVISFISDFLEMARGKLEFNLFIKLHPGYETDKERYTAAFQMKKNVRVLLGSEPPSTFELLTQTHLHLSISSTCHYDALALGVPTVILPFASHENVLHLCEEGHAFLARTPQDLLEIILHERNHSPSEEVGKRYFTPGALENIKKELGNKKENREYRMCTKCIMDTTDPEIVFDENGVCNYHPEYETAENRCVFKREDAEKKLSELVEQIKSAGAGKPYDCVIGLSGGVDSTYVAYQAKKLGLRPLAVHFDNGWDSEIAVKNIENIVRKLNIDLHTLVVDWEEFKDLQLAYLRASIIDVEIPTDFAILATMYELAKRNGIQYILGGHNVVTEQILPKSWYYNKMDFVNLKDIHSKFGHRKLKTYPTLTFYQFVYYTAIRKIRFVSLLDYLPYNKGRAKQTIKEELGWRDYGGKHHESLFTKFYQAYILPRKFNIDKRKCHLSTLICSGQMTREEALAEMQKELYPKEELKADKEYVLKKFGLSEKEFEDIMNLPIRKHTAFATDQKLRRRLHDLAEKTRPFRKLLHL